MSVDKIITFPLPLICKIMALKHNQCPDYLTIKILMATY